MPEAYADQPELDPELLPVFELFWNLDTCRAVGFAPGPIPWTALLAHQQHVGYDNDVRDYLWELIRGMDSAYLNHLAKRPSGVQS